MIIPSAAPNVARASGSGPGPTNPPKTAPTTIPPRINIPSVGNTSPGPSFADSRLTMDIALPSPSIDVTTSQPVTTSLSIAYYQRPGDLLPTAYCL